MSMQYSEDELVQDLQTVADKIGKPPSWAEYRRYGEYSIHAIRSVFGGMEPAREKLSAGESE